MYSILEIDFIKYYFSKLGLESSNKSGSLGGVSLLKVLHYNTKNIL